jgi:hypothetical protein
MYGCQFGQRGAAKAQQPSQYYQTSGDQTFEASKSFAPDIPLIGAFHNDLGHWINDFSYARSGLGTDAAELALAPRGFNEGWSFYSVR